MEDVLDVYNATYDPAHPVVCFDESPKQLVGEVHKPIPVQPGKPARQDTEYQRNGVRDLMMICEPKRGWREVLVMERRTRIEFAHCMRHIVGLYNHGACKGFVGNHIPPTGEAARIIRARQIRISRIRVF
jgi:hypothetical protein